MTGLSAQVDECKLNAVITRLGGGIGRHTRLKICCSYERAGSTPARGTHSHKTARARLISRPEENVSRGRVISRPGLLHISHTSKQMNRRHREHELISLPFRLAHALVLTALIAGVAYYVLTSEQMELTDRRSPDHQTRGPP